MQHTDKFLEKKWKELTDIPFKENEELELILEHKWWLFKAGTDRETIWQFFDKNHSKGVAWLLYEYEEDE